MRAVNHALTGGAVAATVGTLWALPLAFVSHFVLDALPHFDDETRLPTNSKPFWIMTGIDALLVLILGWLVVVKSEMVGLVLAGAFLALSPDIVHLNLVLPRKYLPEGPLHRFHKWIQYSETPKGIIVEALWFFTMSLVLGNLLDG